MRRLYRMIGRERPIQNSLLGTGQVELLGQQENMLRDPVTAGAKDLCLEPQWEQGEFLESIARYHRTKY